MVKLGDPLPDTVFVAMGPAGPEAKSTNEVFAGRNVALFGLPGAYTPICHAEHLPGILALYDVLKQHGIDMIACTAVNDIFVLDRWARDCGAQDKVLMLADGNGDFAHKAGLAVDLSQYGLGVRSNRYTMLVADGSVKLLSVEDVAVKLEKSSAEVLCTMMDQAD